MKSLRSLKTDYKKVSPISSTNIFCIGDPIVDCYGAYIAPGGAWNTYENLKYFTKDILVLFPKEPWIHYQYSGTSLVSPKEYDVYCGLERNIKAPTIVCSDYKKGFISNSKAFFYSDILVLDSKYASTPSSLIANCKLKILKISDFDEKPKSFLSMFDYIIVTNESREIRLYNSKLNLLKSFPVEETYPVCDVGAGDVFTAALTFYIHNEPIQDNIEILFTAIRLSAQLATKTVSLPYTSNLNKLKELDVYY